MKFQLCGFYVWEPSSITVSENAKRESVTAVIKAGSPSDFSRRPLRTRLTKRFKFRPCA